MTKLDQVALGVCCLAFGMKETLELSAKNMSWFLICGIRFCFGWLFGSRLCTILDILHYPICL